MVRGELAELFGEDVLEIDIFQRAIRMAEAAAESFDELEGDEKQTLQAFADGINDYVFSVG